MHFGYGFFESADDAFDIGVAVRRGEEAREPFEKMNALFAQVVVEEAAETEIRREAEIENARKILDVRRHIILRKNFVESPNQCAGSFAELLLEAGALLLEILEDCLHRSERQRVANERPCKESDAHRRIGIVAELPHPSVERIHVLSFARENADRHAAGQDLSIRGEIGANVKERLATARMDAEAGHHFVENKAGVRLLGDLADFFQELDGLQIRMAALHRFDENRGQIVRVAANPFERVGCAVFEHDDVGCLLARNAGRSRNRMRNAALLESLHEHFIEHAVIIACEEHDSCCGQ